PETRENELGQAVGTSYVAVRKTVPVTGTDLKTARPQKGQLGQPVVGFSFTTEGGKKFAELTGNNKGRQLAIVLDNKVVSAPRIEERIENEGIIRGQFTQQQVSVLALLLNLVILLGMMAYFKATLTLPGIAGIILTLGMAIDSNVLVFERIRE